MTGAEMTPAQRRAYYEAIWAREETVKQDKSRCGTCDGEVVWLTDAQRRDRLYCCPCCDVTSGEESR